jgi:protein-S-isoprenylcysteine O-methyltransferase Ste14
MIAFISILLRIAYPAGAYSSPRQQLSNAAPFVSARATHQIITTGKYRAFNSLSIALYISDHNTNSIVSVSILLRIAYPAGAYSSPRQQLSNAAPFVSARATHQIITTGMYRAINLLSIALYISDHNTNSIVSVSILLRISKSSFSYRNNYTGEKGPFK